MSTGVILMAHGTPASLDEMPEYLRLVRGGRPPSAELIAEMRHNYAAIGGQRDRIDSRAGVFRQNRQVSAVAKPMSMPASTSDIPSRYISFCTLACVAPSAIRTGQTNQRLV